VKRHLAVLAAAATAAIALALSSVASADAPSFPSFGAFVLGDATVASAGASDTVTWWSHSWWKANDLTGGTAPASFKGFAESLSSGTPTCGDTWTTTPGNSPHPPDSVPSLMTVLVSSSVTKSGNTISGNIVKVVVVQTDAGYASNPGHPGTGRVVATICGGDELGL
jgi:hypothetical protein